jgi:hypothetical protein
VCKQVTVCPGHIWTTLYMHIYKETVVSARRLLQYFQLPDIYSRKIPRYNYNFLRHFKTVMYFITLFLSEPQTVFCGIFKFRGTQCEKHCFTLLLNTSLMKWRVWNGLIKDLLRSVFGPQEEATERTENSVQAASKLQHDYYWDQGLIEARNTRCTTGKIPQKFGRETPKGEPILETYQYIILKQNLNQECERLTPLGWRHGAVLWIH